MSVWMVKLSVCYLTGIISSKKFKGLIKTLKMTNLMSQMIAGRFGNVSLVEI